MANLILYFSENSKLRDTGFWKTNCTETNLGTVYGVISVVRSAF